MTHDDLRTTIDTEAVPASAVDAPHEPVVLVDDPVPVRAVRAWRRAGRAEGHRHELHPLRALLAVGAVVALARGLGIATTAEGVETREQYETLSALGVQTMQGYYFGRPAPLSSQSFEAKPLAA